VKQIGAFKLSVKADAIVLRAKTATQTRARVALTTASRVANDGLRAALPAMSRAKKILLWQSVISRHFLYTQREGGGGGKGGLP
jgi:hypothetical protein